MWFDSMFPYLCLPVSKRKKLASFEDNIAFQNEFFKWLNIAMFRLDVDGLPDTMSERMLKFSLICGRTGVADDPEMGVIALPATPTSGSFNIYGDADRITLYGYNGFNREYSCYLEGGGDDQDVDAVLVRDNPFGYPILNYIIMYAKNLSDTLRTIQVTALKLKTPYFITCDASQRDSVKEILHSVEFNEDSIITNKSVSPNMFQVLPTNVREGALQSLWNHYNNLEGQIRTILGITSATNQDKRERLLVDEVNSDNELSEICLESRKDYWDHWFEVVNRLFGTNITVDVKETKEYDLQFSGAKDRTGAFDADTGSQEQIPN